MKFISLSSALNLRMEPAGIIIGELLGGDLFDCDAKKSDSVWVYGKILTGYNSGRTGYVRRKWLIQHFDSAPEMSHVDRSNAAKIISRRTLEFDLVHYKLGDKAKSWTELKRRGYIDCSGWIYLLAKDIFSSYGMSVASGAFYTFSDQQITNAGKTTGKIISGDWLTDDIFLPGCVVGLDFAEYSWDRNRPLDIDHIVVIGEDGDGKFVSQSSSKGGGVNRVPFAKWIASTVQLRASGRMHLVDLLAIPAS